ncbi:uncharacterized protein LOC108028670 [Drosophila biarmipes]|uniref:uncharacterized protein LOC108028670 n=1 Tax=Drosophila biarmipes TaxID=125945 RepID=UPI0007E6A33B|nr:uncharacterized protein LOC108028670 [Drosophila biarmipes]
MPLLWRSLWRVVDSLTDPPKRMQDLSVPPSQLSFLTHLSQRSERIFPRRARYPVPSISRHVVFSPSTLEHQKNRQVVVQAETSAFQNFVREMYEAYYQLLLSQETRRHCLHPELQLGNRRLRFKDLVLLQRVARDLWAKMGKERKQPYKDLAMMALHRASLRLPPDPHRIPPHLRRTSKKLQKTRSVFIRI